MLPGSRVVKIQYSLKWMYMYSGDFKNKRKNCHNFTVTVYSQSLNKSEKNSAIQEDNMQSL